MAATPYAVTSYTSVAGGVLPRTYLLRDFSTAAGAVLVFLLLFGLLGLDLAGRMLTP